MSIPSLCNRILFSNVSRFSEKCYGKKGENWNLVISVYKRWLISINFHVFWDTFKRRSFDIQTDLFDTCLISTTNCTKVCLFPTFWGYVLNLFFSICYITCYTPHYILTEQIRFVYLPFCSNNYTLSVNPSMCGIKISIFI